MNRYHYVLLQFEGGEDCKHYCNSIRNDIELAHNEIEGFLSYDILIDKKDPTEATLLIVLEYSSEDALGEYLKHSVHQSMLSNLNPLSHRLSVFDK